MTVKSSHKKVTLCTLFTVLTLCFFINTTATAAADNYSGTKKTAITTLNISTSAATYHFRVTIADTLESRQQGLMWRTQLGADEGMLFVYPKAQPRQFWMKNTFIPLDIIFADENGVIINIEKGWPQSLTLVKSIRPARYVLEINQGQADKLGITAGSRLKLSLLK